MFVRSNMIPCILGAVLLLSGAVDALGRPGEHFNPLAEKARKGIYGASSPSLEFDAPAKFVPGASALNTTNQTLTMHWAELPIDHFAECSDTYKNRYWTQEKWYKPGGPVFVMDAGESSGADLVGWLEGNTYLTRLMSQFGGMGILWEHRYYGASIPQPKNDRTWLTIEQALADIPAMASTFSVPRWSGIDLTPASTPWIFVGGSYPGVRAAMSRERYPNIFHISWAASAPVQARIDMSSYYEPIIPGMQAFNLSSCLADIQAGTKRIDELLSSNTTAVAIKNKFYPGFGASMTNSDFAQRFTLLLGDWQTDLAAGGLSDTCEIIETNPTSNATAPEEGWAPTKGADWVINRMAAAFTGSAFKRSVERRDDDYDNTSWNYQYCTQFGFLHAYGPELDHLISRYNSVSYQESLCQQWFPDVGLPEARAVNQEFGGWRMRPSNTFWTGGEFDPWRTLEPLSGLPGAPEVTISQEVPACGVETPENVIFGQVLPNSGHLFEFNDDRKARDAQATFAKAVAAWLPCFQKKSPADLCDVIPPKCDSEGTGLASGSKISKVRVSNA